MSMYSFVSEEKHKFPYSVTKASDMIAAICNRNDTPKVLGNVKAGQYFIPVNPSVMSHILGEEIALKFTHSMQNPVIRKYYGLLTERLSRVGILLSWSASCWIITKVPSDLRDKVEGSFAVERLYDIDDLVNQKPAGCPRLLLHLNLEDGDSCPTETIKTKVSELIKQ